MATETQTATSPPQLTVLNRVASIPLISDSLATLHTTLTNNAYTRTPYSAAQAIGTRAYTISSPLQIRLAPVIVRADGFANMAVDAVESRYPYPFKTPTEEIKNHFRRNSEHAVDVANKTIDERVKSPAYGIAQGIDQRFTPVVNGFEEVVTKVIGNKPEAAKTNGDASNGQFQYQRAYRISMDLKDHLYVYTNEQIKQIQDHNVLVQRASATAQNISNTIATSYGAAQLRVSAMSDKMLQELQRLQASTASLPSQLQASFSGFSEGVTHTIADLSTIVRSDLPINVKIQKLGTTVEEKVHPLLESTTKTLQETLERIRKKSEVTTNGVVDAGREKKAQVNGELNGH